MKKSKAVKFYIKQYFKAPENTGIFMPYLCIMLLGIFLGESIYQHQLGDIIFAGCAIFLMVLVFGSHFRIFVTRYKETGKREAFLKALAIARSNDSKILALLEEQKSVTQKIAVLSHANKDIETKIKRRMEEIDSEVRTQVSPLLDSKPAMHL